MNNLLLVLISSFISVFNIVNLSKKDDELENIVFVEIIIDGIV